MDDRFNSDPATPLYQDETLPPLTSMGAGPSGLGEAKFLSGALALAAEVGESLSSRFSPRRLLFQGVRIKLQHCPRLAQLG